MEQALVAYMGDLHNCELGGLVRDALREKLAKAKVPESQVHELLSILEVCDQARFSPLGASPTEASQMLQRVKALAEGRVSA